MLSGCGKRGGMGCWSAHIFRTELMKQCSGCFKTFSTPPPSPHFPHPPSISCAAKLICVCVEILRETLFFPLFARSFVGFSLAFASLLPLFSCAAHLDSHFVVVFPVFVVYCHHPPPITTPIEIVRRLKSSRFTHIFLCGVYPLDNAFHRFHPPFPGAGKSPKTQLRLFMCNSHFCSPSPPSISLSWCSSDIIF